MADTLKQLLKNQAVILQEVQTLREEHATGLNRNIETLKRVTEMSECLDTLQEYVLTLDSRVRMMQQKQTRFVSPYSDVENTTAGASNHFASRGNSIGQDRKKKIRGPSGGHAGHLPWGGQLQAGDDSDQSEESNLLSKQNNRKPALQSKLSPSISQPGAKWAPQKEGAIISPVMLLSDPPPNTARPQPSVPKRQNSQMQILSYIKKAPRSGQPLIKPTSQEADLIQAMKTYGLAENNETVAAISSAVQRSNIQAMRAVGLHTVFILDTSASMEQYAQELRTFVNKTIDYIDNSAVDLGLEEHIAIVTCGGQTGICQHFTNDYLQIRNGLDLLTWHGRSPMLTALILTLFYLELQGESIQIHDQVVAPRIVLVSDFNVTSDVTFSGRDEESTRARIEVLGKLYAMCETLKSRGYMVTCVPIAVAANQQVCSDIAETSGGDVVNADKSHLIGNFYKYQLVSSVVLERYNKGMEEGDEPNIDRLIEETLPLAHLAPENTVGVRHVIEKDLCAVGSGSDIDNDLMEKDADTTVSAAAAAAEVQMPASAVGQPQWQSSQPPLRLQHQQQPQQNKDLFKGIDLSWASSQQKQQQPVHPQQQSLANQQQRPVHPQQQSLANQQQRPVHPQQQSLASQQQQPVHQQQQMQANHQQNQVHKPYGTIAGQNVFHATQPQAVHGQNKRSSFAGPEMNSPRAQQFEQQNPLTPASHHSNQPAKQQPRQPMANSATRTQVSPQTAHVRHELPPWGNSASGMDDISLEERSLLPCIGARVQKVNSGVEDGAGPGTVVGHKDKKLVFVLWDTNQLGTYKYEHDMEKEIVVTYLPRQVAPMEIDVGCWVVRGEDWDRGDEDGGPGTVGVVIRKLPNRCVKVRWPSRVVETYRFGADNRWELEVTLAENQSADEHAVAEGFTGGIGITQGVTEGSATPSTGEGERPQIPGEEATVMVWMWQDHSYQWRLFNEAAIQKLETNYNTDPSKPVMVHHKNQSVKVFFSTLKCEIGHNTYSIKRSEITLHGREELLVLEDYLQD